MRAPERTDIHALSTPLPASRRSSATCATSRERTSSTRRLLKSRRSIRGRISRSSSTSSSTPACTSTPGRRVPCERAPRRARQYSGGAQGTDLRRGGPLLRGDAPHHLGSPDSLAGGAHGVSPGARRHLRFDMDPRRAIAAYHLTRAGTRPKYVGFLWADPIGQLYERVFLEDVGGVAPWLRARLRHDPLPRRRKR